MTVGEGAKGKENAKEKEGVYDYRAGEVVMNPSTVNGSVGLLLIHPHLLK